MGLVEYDSDSGSSDGEATPAPSTATATATTTTTSTTAKKPFQKLVNRANPGKILVNLPSAAATVDAEDSDDRPAKRAKIGAAGGSRFSGFSSFLPPPKMTATTSAAAAAAAKSSSPSSTTPPPRPGVNLKTSSEAAFSRRDDAGTGQDDAGFSSSSLSLPPAKAPSIPRDQMAAGDVKLVGNPLMFMPLSVSRKPGKKNKAAAAGSPRTASASSTASAGLGSKQPSDTPAAAAPAPAPAPAAKKKVSLFSLDAHEAELVHEPEDEHDEHDEPEASRQHEHDYDYTNTYTAAPADTYYEEQQRQAGQDPSSAPTSTASLAAFADDMQLSAKERRELFGRTGQAATSAQISATFNMDREYQHNEQLRKTGELEAQQGHQPVRTLMPGKHSLRQLVNSVQTQKDALEETFAKNRASQREAGGKYGWR